MADCHLGYRQYNSRERQNDFTRAYLDIIGAAIDREVDFVLLAGDLFEKRAISPVTLDHAIIGLERLRKAGIPCLAVEGNHELAYYRDSIGWVRFLADRELLTLLNPQLDGERVTLAPCENCRGAYVEPVPGLRVYGMRYYGSSTARVVLLVASALASADKQGIEYTIFMAHAGVEGALGRHGGTLSPRELAPLRRHVDYLALGHIHKPYEFDNWIYNPGSPGNQLRDRSGLAETRLLPCGGGHGGRAKALPGPALQLPAAVCTPLLQGRRLRNADGTSQSMPTLCRAPAPSVQGQRAGGRAAAYRRASLRSQRTYVGSLFADDRRTVPAAAPHRAE